MQNMPMMALGKYDDPSPPTTLWLVDMRELSNLQGHSGEGEADGGHHCEVRCVHQMCRFPRDLRSG